MDNSRTVWGKKVLAIHNQIRVVEKWMVPNTEMAVVLVVASKMVVDQSAALVSQR